jgi:hypothetical protein
MTYVRVAASLGRTSARAQPRSVAERVAELRWGGDAAGAPLRGEARGAGNLIVQLGLWADASGRVQRARWRATTCAALMAYADLACELLESGLAPAALDAQALRAALPCVHPLHRDRADLIVRAIRSAFASNAETQAQGGSL